jgi:hypothetical protein
MMIDPDNLHQHPFALHAIELAAEDLFPSSL